MTLGSRLAPMVFVGLAMVPAAVYAQASITGVVRDTSGAILPGVTVEAASPALLNSPVCAPYRDLYSFFYSVIIFPGFFCF